MFDANGKLIADSKMPDGNNIGCPAAATEVEQFIAVLKKSSRLDDSMARVIYERFRKNEPVK